MSETETAEAETSESEQQHIDGFGPIKSIEKVAKSYKKASDTRLEWLKEEIVLKAKLRKIMKEHEGELPKRKNEDGYEYIFYPLGNGKEIRVIPTDEDVKIVNAPKESK